MRVGSDQPHRTGCCHATQCGKAHVIAEAFAQHIVAAEAEGDGCNRRREDGCRSPLGDLCRQNPGMAGDDTDGQSRERDGDDRNAGCPPLMGEGIHQCPAGELGGHCGDDGEAEGEADLGMMPAMGCEIDGQKRTKPRLHPCNREVEPTQRQ